jgi:CMP-N,N'-diacetyllegionaminic acid synthase
MFLEERIVAIVPARGGSKRLPNKNRLSLSGQPLVCWAITAGLGSGSIDLTVVSTDCPDIRDESYKCGAELVIMRPAELSNDEASTTAVVKHAVECLEEKNLFFEWLVLLQPTSPLRTFEHIEEAIGLIKAKNSKGAVSICRNRHPIEWSGTPSADGLMDSFFLQADLETPSNRLAPTFMINGALYIIRVDEFKKNGTFFLPEGIAAYLMDSRDSVDIDTLSDFEEAEFLMTQRGRNSKIS